MTVTSNEDQGVLTLTVNNGELDVLKKCVDKWGFKDYPSFLRFAISIIGDADDKTVWIKSKGVAQPVFPARNYLKDSGE